MIHGKQRKLIVTPFHNSDQNKLDKNVGKQNEHSPPINILVTGITGCGKSTLIDSVLLRHTTLIKIWETEGFEIGDYDYINMLIGEFHNLVAGENEFHCIWYCKNAGYRKFSACEAHFINELRKVGVPLIVVMTQCLSRESDDEFQSYIASAVDNDIPVIQVLARERILKFDDEVIVIPEHGLDKLIVSSLQRIVKA